MVSRLPLAAEIRQRLLPDGLKMRLSAAAGSSAAKHKKAALRTWKCEKNLLPTRARDAIGWWLANGE
jgi:hypothetical protein